MLTDELIPENLTIDELMNCAEELAQDRKYPDAIALLEQALAHEPHNTSLRSMYSEVLALYGYFVST